MAEMNQIEKINFDSDLQSLIAGLIGKPCCRQRIGRMRSLSIGFGNKIAHGKARLIDDFYGEWGIGTYLSAWRVVHEDVILCGSQDVVESLSELDERLGRIEIGRIQEINFVSKFHIQAYCDNGIYIDFLAASSDDDEMFHIFCPEGVCIEYSVLGGWGVSRR
ncbi:MAG: hypothetical protein PHF31_12025 [Methylobacter sp.]|nr:hypothetical protein [Methylobacter sp.]